ncbi:MAG TPA: helix-turn-helix transcriptional regulator [Candidatus Dojkabacteria bacterium]|jgi:transcriptional regulator with XRE-family HTH domain|nr:helix-turn-helix transcriptional regulator [Candidatus Dojkabacteria bacterium]
MTSKKLGERLKKAREEKRLTQRELAIKVGLSDKSISIYEKGKVYPPIRNLLILSRELDVSISDLLTD